MFIRKILLPGIVLFFGVSVAEANDCTGTFGWLSVGQNVNLEEGHSVFTGHFSGTFVANDTTSSMHLNAVMCPAIYQVNQGQTKSLGFCWQQDGDGDRIYYSWSCEGEYPHCDGNFAAYSGTGKYKGVKSRGTFKALTMAFGDHGNGHGYSVWDTCEYQLP